MKRVSIEYFYYGKRTKATIEVITLENNNRMFVGHLYTHGMKEIESKTFFNKRISSDYKKQNELYSKCYKYVTKYLNTCKY